MAKKRKSAATPKKAKAKPKRKTGRPGRKAGMVVAVAGGQPPYKCQTTLEPGVCLRFNRNPTTGQYNLPPGGIRVSCTDCEYFF